MKENSYTQEIYDIFLEIYKKSEYGYVVSWHLAQEMGIKTNKVNYHPRKKVKDGILLFRTFRYCTHYFPAGTNPYCPLGKKSIISTNAPEPPKHPII